MAEGQQQLNLLFVNSVSVTTLERRLDVVQLATGIAQSIGAALSVVVIVDPLAAGSNTPEAPALEGFVGSVSVGPFPVDRGNDYWLVTTLEAAQSISRACESGFARHSRVLYLLDAMQPGFYPWDSQVKSHDELDLDTRLRASTRLAEEFAFVAKSRAIQLTELQRAMARLRRRLPESQQEAFNRLRRKAAEYDRFRNRKVVRFAAATTRPLEKVVRWAKTRRGAAS
jgi:hypothetical protein